MNLMRFIAAGLLLMSIDSLYAMTPAGIMHSYTDCKTKNVITIIEKKLDEMNDNAWDDYRKFAMQFHGRNPDEECEANSKLNNSFDQLRFRFEHAGLEGVDTKDFDLPEHKEDCLVSAFYDGDKVVGIGIVELVDQRATSVYTLADFKTYDPVMLLSEFIFFFRMKFPQAKSFVKSAPKARVDFQVLLQQLGFKQVSDELDHCIRRDRRANSVVFEFVFSS